MATATTSSQPLYTATFIATIKEGGQSVWRHVSGHAPSEADFLNQVFETWGKGCWEFRVTSCKCIA